MQASPQVVLVTGGTKGIGAQIALRYADEGHTVVVCGRAEPENLDERLTFIACDVRNAAHVQEMVATIVQRCGHLDVVINNAGGAPHAEAATASPRFHEAIIALNLTAPLHVAQAANAVMQTQPTQSSIINIASVSGTRPSPGTAAYGAAKAGLLNLTESLAVEWAPKVRVNSLTCGLILTEQAELHYGDDDGVAAVAGTIPLRRLGTPDDIADACVFLSSSSASYISGSSITLHGGGERPAFLDAANAET